MAEFKPVAVCLLVAGAAAFGTVPATAHDPGPVPTGAFLGTLHAAATPGTGHDKAPAGSADPVTPADGGAPAEHGNIAAVAVAGVGVLSLVGSAAVARRRTGAWHRDAGDRRRDVAGAAARTDAGRPGGVVPAGRRAEDGVSATGTMRSRPGPPTEEFP